MTGIPNLSFRPFNGEPNFHAVKSVLTMMVNVCVFPTKTEIIPAARFNAD